MPTVDMFPRRPIAGQRWEVVPFWSFITYSSFTKSSWVFAAAVIVLVSWIVRGDTIMTLSSWTDGGKWETHHSLISTRWVTTRKDYHSEFRHFREPSVHCHHSFTDLISCFISLWRESSISFSHSSPGGQRSPASGKVLKYVKFLYGHWSTQTVICSVRPRMY